MSSAAIPLELVAAPLVLHRTAPRPTPLLRTSVRELCELAGIQCRVTGGPRVVVILYVGQEHFRSSEGLYVAVRDWKRDREHALRALEVLAYGFCDYAARESVCGRGLFSVPVRRGPAPIGGRTMTAAERMRRMRARAS